MDEMSECACCGEMYCYRCPGNECLCHRAARAVQLVSDAGLFHTHTLPPELTYIPATHEMEDARLVAAH